MLKVRQSLPLPSSWPSSQTLNALSAANAQFGPDDRIRFRNIKAMP